MPLIAVLSLVLLFLGHSTLAGITGLIFALLFLAGFRHEKRILVLWAVMTGFALAFFVPPGLVPSDPYWDCVFDCHAGD